MPRKLREGDRIRNYTVIDRIVSGAFAICYRGLDAGGKSVFIKQFKSPTPLNDWYDLFVDHQVELQKAIASSPVHHFAITLIDQFEETLPPHHRARCFFQVTEFVTDGQDLSVLIGPSSSVRWHQRTVWAKVIMGSIHQFHQAQIVHTDLKPDNLFLIKDPTIKAGHKLKVIDLDSAIFDGRNAPWHDNGYVGTPGYYSPEHGSSTTIPSAKSDIFSAGLILYELLGDGHPYLGLGNDEYRDNVMCHAARPPKLLEPMPKGNDGDVVAVIHQMLSPNPTDRPEAQQVLKVLNGATAPLSNDRPTREWNRPARSVGSHTQLRLCGEVGKKITLNINTTLCQPLISGLGEPKYWDKVFQVRLEPEGGVWYAVPNTSAPNDTCINEEILTARTQIKHGDVLTVGRASRKIFKSPLRIELEHHA